MDDLDSQIDDLGGRLRETARKRRAERQAARVRRAERPAALWERAERSKLAAGLGLVFMAIIVGLFLFALGIRELLQEQAFAERGLTVSGTVVGLRTAGRGEDFSYLVDYEFVVPETGTRVRDTGRVNGSDWHALRPAGPIAVTYLSTDPGMSRVDGGGVLPGLYWIAISVGFVAFGLILGILALLRRRA